MFALRALSASIGAVLDPRVLWHFLNNSCGEYPVLLSFDLFSDLDLDLSFDLDFDLCLAGWCPVELELPDLGRSEWVR